MLKNKLNKKVDYTFSQYYNNCDFINKYNLKSFNKKPFIKSIILKISLEKIVNCFLLKYQYDNENLQTISFLFFYIISAMLPFINFNKSNSLKLINSNYSLKIIYNKENEIYSFLHDIYENFKLENIKDTKSVQNSFVFNEICRSSFFFELENILSNYIKIVNLKELNFSLSFKIVNFKNFTSKKTLIKNFLFLDK